MASDYFKPSRNKARKRAQALMNPDLNLLQPYPFEKLAALKAGITPPAALKHIALSIGEPKHAAPKFVVQALQDNLDKLGNYPKTKGIPELREAITKWLNKIESLV